MNLHHIIMVYVVVVVSDGVVFRMDGADYLVLRLVSPMLPVVFPKPRETYGNVVPFIPPVVCCLRISSIFCVFVLCMILYFYFISLTYNTDIITM